MIFSHVLAGDIDGNGTVEFADFLALSNKFGTACPDCPEDLNSSGTVDFADFLILSANFGKAAAATSVPEPTCGLLLLIAVLGFLRLRTRSLKAV